MQVTAAQKQAFMNDGVVCLRGVLTPSEVSDLRQSVGDQIKRLGHSRTGYDLEAFARQLWGSENHIDFGEADRFDRNNIKTRILADSLSGPLLEAPLSESEGCFFHDAAAWRRDLGVRQVAFDSLLPELVAQLIDTKYVNLWSDTTFAKAPGTRQKTAFHQDLGYNKFSSDHAATVWIPLDSASPENGVLEYVRGSHKWAPEYAPNVLISSALKAEAVGAGLQRVPAIDNHREDFDIISFDVEPGDVLVHHIKTVHGAGGNMSQNWRRAVSFVYCGDQARYFDRPGAVEPSSCFDTSSQDDRLMSKDHPMVWPKPWPGIKLAPLYSNDCIIENSNTELEHSREVA